MGLKKFFLILGLFLLWAVSHWIIVSYGTHQTPIYSYYGSADEQSPLLGVMHMAEGRSLLAMRGHESVYYGPIFSVIAAPAVVLDVAQSYLQGGVRTAADYKIWFSFNWGNSLFWARWAAVLAGFIGLFYAWRLLNLPLINPGGNRWLAWLGVLLLGTNFFYFLYSGWLRHWIFLSVFFIMQAYYLIQVKERARRSDWIWLVIVSVLSFGIGYVSLVFQIMWLPLLIHWWRAKDYRNLKRFLLYLLAFSALMILTVAWNPTPYLRYVNLSKTAGLSFSPLAMPSLVYYLKIIVFNQPFLSLGFALAFIAVFCLQKKYRSYWTWLMILGGLAHLALFASNVHCEPRYVMPVTFAMILLTVGWLTSWEPGGRHKGLAVLTTGLLCLEIVWQVSNCILWSYGAMQGPEDKQLIGRLVSLPPDEKVLVSAWHFLGAAHSKEIIKNYATARFGDKELSNMLSFFSQTAPPAWMHIIDNIDYSYGDRSAGGLARDKFNYFVYYTGEPLATNYFEERLTRLWYLSDLRLRYFIVKNK